MLSLNETEQRAWRGFLHTHDALLKALDGELVKDDLNLPAYKLLTTLQEAGGQGGPGGMRMTDLARALRFSGGGLTRLADKLERQGFLERRCCPEDGRGLEAILTEDGARKLRRVHAKHLREVRRRFLDKLNPVELTLLASLWERLQESYEAYA